MPFESKARFVTSKEMDEFYQKIINEPEFRKWSTGGHKSNLIPVILAGKTAESSAFQKASRMGIRIVLHTSVEDCLERLLGQRETFHKIISRAGPRL